MFQEIGGKGSWDRVYQSQSLESRPKLHSIQNAHHLISFASAIRSRSLQNNECMTTSDFDEF